MRRGFVGIVTLGFRAAAAKHDQALQSICDTHQRLPPKPMLIDERTMVSVRALEW